MIFETCLKKVALLRDIMDMATIECLTKIQADGQEQYNAYAKERLKDRSTAITETITHNKVMLFNAQPQKVKSKAQENVVMLRNEPSLFF